MPSSMDISATEDTVKSVLSREYRFEVPDYQREYSWKEKHWEDFWNDLMHATENNTTHFLGSIVVIKQDFGIDELDILEIVDGQQRLVTISILLCLIREKFKNTSEDEWEDPQNTAQHINRQYLFQEDEHLNKYPNITLSTFDNDDYKKLLDGRIPDNEESQLLEAARYFSQQFTDLSLDEVDTIRKRLVNSITLVTIECNSENSAFKLFETLNDRGLELTSVDLMKNRLFSHANTNPDVDYERIQRDWEDILHNIKPNLKKPSRFFQHYLMSAPEPDLRESVSSYLLYDRFSEIIETDLPESSLSIENYVEDMAEHAPLYVDIVLADIELYNERQNQRINQHLENLNVIGATQERTILFRLFRELDNAQETIRALKIMESFVFRWRMNNEPTGSDVYEIHAKICSDIFGNANPVQGLRNKLEMIAPSDEELEIAIRNTSFPRNARTRYILGRIEDSHYSTEESRSINPATVEIEHIAPRSTFNYDKYSNWVDYLDCSEEEFEEYKNRIGNLTLLNERMNARAQDNPFEQKKREYESAEFRMTEKICEFEYWSLETIERRTKQLSEIVPRIWDFNI